MKRSFISLFLILLCACVFAACGPTPDEGMTESNTLGSTENGETEAKEMGSVTESQTSAPSETEKKDDEWDTDGEGKETENNPPEYDNETENATSASTESTTESTTYNDPENTESESNVVTETESAKDDCGLN